MRRYSPANTLTRASLHIHAVLAYVREVRQPRVASLTASEAQDVRMELLAKVKKLTDELFAIRNAKQLAEEGQLHVYRALTVLIRVENSILNDAALDEIQAMLESADGEISQAQQSKKGG